MSITFHHPGIQLRYIKSALHLCIFHPHSSFQKHIYHASEEVAVHFDNSVENTIILADLHEKP